MNLIFSSLYDPYPSTNGEAAALVWFEHERKANNRGLFFKATVQVFTLHSTLYSAKLAETVFLPAPDDDVIFISLATLVGCLVERKIEQRNKLHLD